MKYFILFFSVCIVSSFSAQTRISKISEPTESSKIFSPVKKARIDINKLNVESKIVGKTALPALYRFKTKQLILNGAGLRELLWVDVYACGLYLRRPETKALKIINKDETTVIRMDILSKAVSHKKLVRAFEKGFEDANGEAVVRKLKPEITEFIRHIDGLALKIGDKIDIVYEPYVGVSLYINYKKIGTVGDLEFKKAILRIWLSDNPVDKSLRTEMLDGASEFLDK